MNFSYPASLEMLVNTPQVLSALLTHLSPGFTHYNEGENTWTVKDVVAHLIVCEQTDWIPRINTILHHPEVPFSPIDMQAHFSMAENNTLVNLLHTFTSERKKSLQELDALRLQETDFLREGIHPVLGKVTLQQLMGTWVVHDLSHLSQINRIMAYQFAHLVGPFKQFLKILPSS